MSDAPGPVALLSSSHDAARGFIEIELVAHEPIPSGWQLAFTSTVQLTPTDARLVDRLSTFHLMEPHEPQRLDTGELWRESCSIGHEPRHANDGPVSAYLVDSDGVTLPVEVRRLTTATPTATGRIDAPHPAELGRGVAALVPYPQSLEIDEPATRAGERLAFESGPDHAAAGWDAIVDLEARLRSDPRLAPNGSIASTDDAQRPVVAATDTSLAEGAYTLDIDADRVRVTAATDSGFRHAFVTLAQWAATGLPSRATVADHPRFAWRGIHIDVARRWYHPDLVAHLIDVAAWRKMSRVHLHLTDDEGWRLPVTSRPELAARGGTRGHGSAIPPMFGGGPEPHGRAYADAEIALWNARARDLGVVLVPEIDLPAHMHAALTADPGLRDPDDTSGATSVQHYTDNVLVPGHDATWPFVVAVFDAVADLFPDSPWIHIGADEVPTGSWRGSPAAARYREQRGLESTSEIEASFVRDVAAYVRERHGRSVGAWEEAGENGGVAPGDGFVIGWQTVDASRSLAARGYDVVVAPGQAYYLDMAPDDGWDTPGASWAGTTTFETTCEFDPTAGWSDAELEHLLGIQGCLWSEHVRDDVTFDTLVFPRLDAIAERAWSAAIHGGPDELLARRNVLVALERPRPGID